MRVGLGRSRAEVGKELRGEGTEKEKRNKFQGRANSEKREIVCT